MRQPSLSWNDEGAVNKSNNGSSCFKLVVDNITINGKGSILAHEGLRRSWRHFA
jgi:hypothetical protein